LIELSGVGKTYRSMRGTNYQALKDFDLQIHEGEQDCHVN
jgi:ABC-type methionine transport system ATPase subunit